MMRRLKDAGYAVLMTCVFADRGKCVANGRGREIAEGKRYSPRAWKWTIKNAAALFNLHRKLGFMAQTSFVFDNTDWSHPAEILVRPGMGVQVEMRHSAQYGKKACFKECALKDVSYR